MIDKCTRAQTGACPEAIGRMSQPGQCAVLSDLNTARILASLGPGQALPPSTRRDMESLLGTDLGQVRLHRNAAAEYWAQQIGAQAFTIGAHIAFARGAFCTTSPCGRALLGHELAHTLRADKEAGCVYCWLTQAVGNSGRTYDLRGVPQAIAPDGTNHEDLTEAVFKQVAYYGPGAQEIVLHWVAAPDQHKGAKLAQLAACCPELRRVGSLQPQAGKSSSRAESLLHAYGGETATDIAAAVGVLLDEAVRHFDSGHVVHALRLLGISLHTVQDIYSHNVPLIVDGVDLRRLANESASTGDMHVLEDDPKLATWRWETAAGRTREHLERFRHRLTKPAKQQLAAMQPGKPRVALSPPGAAMAGRTLFITSFRGPCPELYQLWWDGKEWAWVNHGQPAGTWIATAPGATMGDQKLFVVSEDGRLYERHWRNDLPKPAWVWRDHGRPEDARLATAPGAAMGDQKLFVVSEDGRLYERHWRSDLPKPDWVWRDHGRPGNNKIVHPPGAAMGGEKLFVVTEDGQLYQRHWRQDIQDWVWQPHGRPDNKRIVTAPGAAMGEQKLFVVTEDGRLYELCWSENAQDWVWVDHRRPPNTRCVTAPGAAMANRKLFVGTADERLFERYWNGTQWVWVNHEQPCAKSAPGGTFVTTSGTRFWLEGRALYFAGANNYYLGYQPEGMVDSVLDSAQAMGLGVIRTWGAIDRGSLDGSVADIDPHAGSRGVYYQYWDPKSKTPVYNDGPNGLQKLDYAISAAGKRGLKLIIVLVNNWREYGGIDQYLTWYGLPYHDQFYTHGQVRQAYRDWVEHLLKRTNHLTGVQYRHDPTIMAWELANEPRCEGSGIGGKPTSGGCKASTLLNWVKEMSAFIKQHDPYHLVAVGDEGFFNWEKGQDELHNGSTGGDFEAFLRVPTIDLGTFHLYPEGWKRAASWGTQWIQEHLATADQVGKPVILEEYGLEDKKRRSAAYEAWLGTLYNQGGAGDLFWMLSGRQDDEHCYPDFDGFTVYCDPASPTIIRHAADMSAKS